MGRLVSRFADANIVACSVAAYEEDEMLIEAAMSGGAEAIVTFNVQDFLPAAAVFDARVLTPAEVLLQIRRH